jgi:predicted  nucleic acid-binding Zn-ribbon protein
MQNSIQNSATDGSNSHAQRQRIQYELSIADSDLRKLERDKEIEEMELKRLEKQLALLNVNILERKQKIKKIENDKMMIENDVKSLKKKLNVIV